MLKVNNFPNFTPVSHQTGVRNALHLGSHETKILPFLTFLRGEMSLTVALRPAMNLTHLGCSNKI